MNNLFVLLQSKPSLFSRFKDSYYFDLFVFVRNTFLFLLFHPRDLVAFVGICFLAVFQNFHRFVLILVYLSSFLFFFIFLFHLLT